MVERYPHADLLVKNTFLNYDTLRPPSLEGFFQEREVRSAPGSGNLEKAQAREVDLTPSRSRTAPDEVSLLVAAAAAAAADPAAALTTAERSELSNTPSPPRHVDMEVRYNEQLASAYSYATNLHCNMDSGMPYTNGHYVSSEADNFDAGPVKVLHLAQALGDSSPRLGTTELPTVGSSGHHLGLCKPCAFLEKGCQSGVDCKFCHLCAPDEKKRRKKEKMAFRRQINRWQKNMTEFH